MPQPLAFKIEIVYSSFEQQQQQQQQQRRQNVKTKLDLKINCIQSNYIT